MLNQRDYGDIVVSSLLKLNNPETRNPIAHSQWMRLHAHDVISYGFGSEPLTTRKELIDAYEEWYAAFPDLEIKFKKTVVCSEWVVTSQTLRGTQLSEYESAPPTGRVMTLDSLQMVRLAEGKIVERWNVIDRLDALEELGLWPPGAGRMRSTPLQEGQSPRG